MTIRQIFQSINRQVAKIAKSGTEEERVCKPLSPLFRTLASLATWRFNPPGDVLLTSKIFAPRKEIHAAIVVSFSVFAA